MKILVEYTAAELRALIDADFSDPNYGAAIERSEQALEVEQGSCGSIVPAQWFEDPEAA